MGQALLTLALVGQWLALGIALGRGDRLTARTAGLVAGALLVTYVGLGYLLRAAPWLVDPR